MGTGKTSWAINHMNSHPENSYIVIAPLLEECKRYQTDVKSVNLIAPKHNGMVCGRTESGRLVTFDGTAEDIGKFEKVMITESRSASLFGHKI